MTLFDFRLIHVRKQRASKNWHEHAFLHHAVSVDLIERLMDVKKQFHSVLLYNDIEGTLNQHIQPQLAPENFVVKGNFTAELATHNTSTTEIVYDENHWPFREEQFDLIITHLAHHLLCDPFKTFQIIQKSLQKDGLMMGSFFGEQTLSTLRSTLFETEEALNMGHAPRVLPFMTMDKVAHVLNAIGYRYVVVDKSTYTVDYKNLSSLIDDLRGMAETNVLSQQHKTPLTRSFLRELDARYPRTHQGLLPLIFEIIYFAGWRHV